MEPGTGSSGGNAANPNADNTGDAADKSDRQRGSSLNYALESAAEGRNTDPELLKELGMTQEEFTDFAKRVTKKEAKPEPEEVPAPLDANQRRFGTDSQIRTSSVRGAGKTAQDSQQSMFGGNRVEAPPEYRALFEAYTKSIGRVTKEAKPAKDK